MQAIHPRDIERHRCRRPASAANIGVDAGAGTRRCLDHAVRRPAVLGTRAAGHAADRRLSQSLLRGLSLLSWFGPERVDRGGVELAAEPGMSASTAHRYAVTLVEIGLVERSNALAQVPPAA